MGSSASALVAVVRRSADCGRGRDASSVRISAGAFGGEMLGIQNRIVQKAAGFLIVDQQLFNVLSQTLLATVFS